MHEYGKHPPGLLFDRLYFYSKERYERAIDEHRSRQVVSRFLAHAVVKYFFKDPEQFTEEHIGVWPWEGERYKRLVEQLKPPSDEEIAADKARVDEWEQNLIEGTKSGRIKWITPNWDPDEVKKLFRDMREAKAQEADANTSGPTDPD
jgi:hypothetical protein